MPMIDAGVPHAKLDAPEPCRLVERSGLHSAFFQSREIRCGRNILRRGLWQNEGANFAEWFALNIRHARGIRRMTDYEKEEGLFVRRSFQNAIQKCHWTWRVRERDQTRVMNRRDQESSRDADGFRRVIMFHARAVGPIAVRLREDCDQPGRDFEERFSRIGAERRERLQPFFRRAVLIKLALLFFGRDADLVFHRRISHRHEMPRLQVRSAWCAARRAQAGFDYRARDRT